MILELAIVAILVISTAAFLSKRKTKEALGKVVQSKCGAILGVTGTSRDGREFYEWRGIPYAKPPVGPLRFASPQPFGTWDGVRDGSKYGSPSVQFGALDKIVGDEDCLYLNVSTPKVSEAGEKELLPVMVFVHGGGFQGGFGNQYQPHYFMDEDVLIVTINYRLGLFGFLNTGDKHIRGNMGLKDQALALKWIQDNIQSFGGNPKNVTVFGESAGASSVHYLCLSPSTKGLFQKAICQSGVASSAWAQHNTADAVDHAKRFANHFHCDTGDTRKILECLRTKSVEELMAAYKPVLDAFYVYRPHLDGQWFRPSVEAVDDAEAFLTRHPLDVIKEGKAHRIPWMTGVTTDEGLVSSLHFYRHPKHLETYESNWTPSILRTFGVPESHRRAGEIAEKMKDLYYPPVIRGHDQKWKQFTKVSTDALFNLHMSECAHLQRQFSPVYLYSMSRRGGPSITFLFERSQKVYPAWVEMVNLIFVLVLHKVFGMKFKDHGVCHGDDLAMLFRFHGIFDVTKDPKSKDYLFSKDMVRLWVQFARDEKSMNLRGVSVPAQNPSGPLTYLDITDNPKLIPEPFKERTDFLKSLDIIPQA